MFMALSNATPLPPPLLIGEPARHRYGLGSFASSHLRISRPLVRPQPPGAVGLARFHVRCVPCALHRCPTPVMPVLGS